MQQEYVLLPECEGVQKFKDMMDAVGVMTVELHPTALPATLPHAAICQDGHSVVPPTALRPTAAALKGRIRKIDVSVWVSKVLS